MAEEEKLTLRGLLELMEKKEYNAFKLCPITKDGKEGTCVSFRREPVPQD